MKQDEWQIGSLVKVRDQQTSGELIAIDHKRATIAFGGITVYTSLNALVPVAKKKEKKSAFSKKKSTVHATVTTYVPTSTTIDLHGMYKEEALVAVDQFIDRSLLQGHTHLKIIHGKGMGILRQAVRSYLQTHIAVKKVIDYHPFQCTAGTTWIEL